MFQRRIEYSIYSVIVVLAVVDVVLISQSQMRIDWEGYRPSIGFALLLIALGLFYRFYRGVERIASVLLGTGAFVSFTLVASVFNYTLLPLNFPRIDPYLLAMDASFGYSWEVMVEWAAAHPTASRLLRYIYFSSLPQLIIIVLILGFSGRLRSLWHFLSTGMLGVLLCIGVWFFFPSFGPTTLIVIDPATLDNAGLALGPGFAENALRLAVEGEQFLTPRKVLGLIAFPSFHTVMALMAVVFMWNTGWMRWPVLCLNLAMVPAILIHGSHYAVDVPAGLAVFALSYFLMLRIGEK